MLHLTRKLGESAVIGDDQSVCVVEIANASSVALRVWDARRASGRQEFLVSVSVGEALALRDNVRVVVNSIRGRSVSLGFDAERAVAVQRGERYVRGQAS